MDFIEYKYLKRTRLSLCPEASFLKNQKRRQPSVGFKLLLIALSKNDTYDHAEGAEKTATD